MYFQQEGDVPAFLSRHRVGPLPHFRQVGNRRVSPAHDLWSEVTGSAGSRGSAGSTQARVRDDNSSWTNPCERPPTVPYPPDPHGRFSSGRSLLRWGTGGPTGPSPLHRLPGSVSGLTGTRRWSGGRSCVSVSTPVVLDPSCLPVTVPEGHYSPTSNGRLTPCQPRRASRARGCGTRTPTTSSSRVVGAGVGSRCLSSCRGPCRVRSLFPGRHPGRDPGGPGVKT